MAAAQRATFAIGAAFASHNASANQAEPSAICRSVILEAGRDGAVWIARRIFRPRRSGHAVEAREPEEQAAARRARGRAHAGAEEVSQGGIQEGGGADERRRRLGLGRQAVAHVRTRGPAALEAPEKARTDRETALASPATVVLQRVAPAWSLVAAGAFAACLAVVVLGRPDGRPAGGHAEIATVAEPARLVAAAEPQALAELPRPARRDDAQSAPPPPPLNIMPPQVAERADPGPGFEEPALPRVLTTASVPLPPVRPRNIGAEARPLIQRASLADAPPPRPEP